MTHNRTALVNNKTERAIAPFLPLVVFTFDDPGSSGLPDSIARKLCADEDIE